MLESALAEVAVAAVSALAGWLLKPYQLAIKTYFSGAARENAKLIEGRWDATETYANKMAGAFDLELKCVGEYVEGTQTYLSGDPVDQGKKFLLRGSLHNLVINVTWKQENGAETGSLALRYNDDKRLTGRGLYVYQDAVHASTFVATKRP